MTLSQFARLGRSLLLAIAALAVAAPAASAEKGVENAAEKAERAADKAVEKTEEDEKAAAEKPVAEKPATSGGCESRVFTRVFQPWNDRALYTLAPGGDFETLAEGWTLEGPAVVAADSSPFLLGTALGVGSLELPAGATALSPPICVQRGFTHFRFLARSISAEAGALKVQVLYADGRTKKAGRLTPAAEWAPSRKISLAQGRFRTRRRASTLIQLRFAATAGAVRVDDVYVDPRYHR